MGLYGKAKLDDLATAAFDSIESEAPDGSLLGAALLVLEVRTKNPDTTAFFTFCTDSRRWIQRALLQEGSTALEWIDNERTIEFQPGDEEELDD